MWWKKRNNETLFYITDVFHTNHSLVNFLKEGPSLQGAGNLCCASCDIHPSGRGSCSAPHHTLCSSIVRNEIISSSQQRWKRKGKGQEGKIAFQRRFQSMWSFTNLEKKTVKGWFKWFMGFSLETHKTPRRCRELLYWLPVYTLNLWQQSALSVAS